MSDGGPLRAIALFLAVPFFGERPDATTLAGAAIVIGSGLFVLLRARREMRPPRIRRPRKSTRFENAPALA